MVRLTLGHQGFVLVTSGTRLWVIRVSGNVVARILGAAICVSTRVSGTRLQESVWTRLQDTSAIGTKLEVTRV